VAGDRDRFHKVLAIAINPGAPEGEATAGALEGDVASPRLAL
jgi:hypothetical protein